MYLRTLCLLPFIFILTSQVHAESACTSTKSGNPEALFNHLNSYAEARLEKINHLDEADPGSQAQADQIKTDIETEITQFRASIQCLSSGGLVTADGLENMNFRASLLETAIREGGFEGNIENLLNQQLEENDPSGVYLIRAHNRLRYLDQGSEFRDEVLETIRSARRFIDLSYFELYPDRMGYTVTAMLIAKKLGKNKPCEIAEVARALNLPLPLNASLCEDKAVVTAPIPDASFPAPGRETLEALATKLRIANPTLQPIDIRIYLDNSKRSYSKLERGGVVGALTQFGIEFKVERGIFFNFYSNNHAKITASDHRAVISGGNIKDQIMDWTPTRRFRDAAILVEGELVNDVHHFFLAKFEGIRNPDLNGHLCPDLDAGCLAGFFPPENMDHADFRTPGRLIWSSNFDLKTTPTWRMLLDLIKSAQHSLYFENAFFSDGLLAVFLHAKAHHWGLRRAKDANSVNGEIGTRATCGPGYFETVAKRPGGRFMLIILPKDNDQIFATMAERVLTNDLLLQGVDVCKWSGKLNNQVNPQPDGRVFEDKTMLHSKVMIADERFAYVGSANLNRRSSLGDLELGILTEDPDTVKSIQEKVFMNDVRAAERVHFNLLNYLLMPLQLVMNLLGFT